MEKDEVLKALKKEGRFAEYDDLYSDNVSLSDWVSRNEDLIRSNRNIAKAVGVDTPKGGVKDSYFEGQDIDKEKYERSEKKLSEAQAEKQRLADEYQRAKDIEDFSEFRSDKGILGNLLALGMKLTPEAAKNVYIKEGYKPGKLALHGGLGTMANVSEILPGTGPVARAATVFGGPAIRAGQDIYEGKSRDEVLKNFTHDAGLNTLFEYMPVKEAYNYGKRILGRQGGAGEKAISTKVSRELDKIDALEHAKENHMSRMQLQRKLEDFQRQYNKGILNDVDVLNFADEIEPMYPDMSKKLRLEVNARAENRDAAEDIVISEYLKEPFERDVNIAREMNTAKTLPKFKEAALEAVDEAEKDAWRKANYDYSLLDDAGNLRRPMYPLDASTVWRESNPSDLTKKAVKALPYARAAAKSYSGPDRESMAPKDKDYDNAIEYIISNYSRQWDAGFKPHGGIELEAWKKYKGIE